TQREVDVGNTIENIDRDGYASACAWLDPKVATRPDQAALLLGPGHRHRNSDDQDRRDPVPAGRPAETGRAVGAEEPSGARQDAAPQAEQTATRTRMDSQLATRPDQAA